MQSFEEILKPFESKINQKIKDQKKFKSKKGFYLYELEADTTIPSEYILLMHFLGDINLEIQEKIRNYLLKKQNKDGGWPLFFDGDSDISASVKAYFALKLAGLDEKNDVMKLAKKFIHKKGGAENVNVFTRISLALFGQVSWKSVPFMPVEIINFPMWFPFNIYKISYWSRTVLVPLLIIMHRKPAANNPQNISVSELFKKEQFSSKIRPTKKYCFKSKFFIYLDKFVRLTFPIFFLKSYKESCVEKSYSWILERLNNEDGLGGIFPAMVNALICLSIDQKSRFKNQIKVCRKSIDNLLVIKKKEAYCQPCLSPIWDTGWMGHVLLENNNNVDDIAQWFLDKEIKLKGDWCINKNIKPGGWAFQFNNEYYPDVDDTALIGMFLHRYNNKKKYIKIENCLERTRQWIISMQSKNGGWGAFDIDNNKYYLNSIPFADHGALLDPPTSDVTARCLSFLKQQNNPDSKQSIQKGLKYLLSEQENNGSWYGRWGTNYIYGTWSVLCALNLIEFPEKKKVFEKAVNYLNSMQRLDGGWGEDGKSYYSGYENMAKQSTPSQASWAIMGLVAAGQIDSIQVKKGIKYLLQKDLKWEENYYTAVGFPKVFYLKYHGYAKYFPLLTLKKIKNILQSNSKLPVHGV